MATHTINRDTSIPAEQSRTLQDVTRPHVDAFNFMIKTGLDLAVADLDPKIITDRDGHKLTVWIDQAKVGYPRVPDNEARRNPAVFPTECRERASTYKSDLHVTLKWKVDDGPVNQTERKLGQIPIMVKSQRCNLRDLSPTELVANQEEAEEMGGYFIINGIERIMRMLLLPRRNYVMALDRPSFRKRGPEYTTFGTMIRCTRLDQTSQTITVHFLQDGNCMVRFSYRKNEYLVPAVLILKALVTTTDQEIFERIVGSSKLDSFLTDRVELMLRSATDMHVHNSKQARVFLGERFRIALDVPEDMSDEDVGRLLLRKLMLIHLDNDQDKFDLLVFMIQKLYKVVSGDCCTENADSPMNHEILTSGQLYLMFLKEKMEEYLTACKAVVAQDLRRNPEQVSFSAGSQYFTKSLSKNPVDIGRRLEYLMATGNLASATGLDLQQVSGFTVVADKLNFLRYLSHFRCIHRGAFFAEMKTTTVRKLLPEAWGFVCPVHTPDGAPCGLLNHLAAKCLVVDEVADASRVPAMLIELGMAPIDHKIHYPSDYLNVLLDGRIIGKLAPENAAQITAHFRYRKAQGHKDLPRYMESALVLPSERGQFPGLFIFTSLCRMVRPVQNLIANTVEYIGSFEQVYMDIAVLEADIVPGVTTHHELSPTAMLSVNALMTPYSDHNQSPRNMYQCQMGKQTMGTPAHALQHRSDNKLYRVMNPQASLVRPQGYEDYKCDNYPSGTNAVIAFVSYTGYDMEDAMIINKGSYDRGFGYATIYKTQIVDLAKLKPGNRENSKPTLYFGTVRNQREVTEKQVEADGFPPLETVLKNGAPICSYVDETTNMAQVVKYKSSEEGYLHEIKLIAGEGSDQRAQRAIIRFRLRRNPVIGDKFASRHGQKGVCSQLWPSEGMPFCESGMVPDILFNPHGFPSRMTIGMWIETMAGKSAALHGVVHDASPFVFNEKSRAVDYFGEQLAKAGYNYYGSERMYSGVTGKEFDAEIFMGVVYYQRLRHMVLDKYQVRTTGPVHNLTHQPIKGRKRAGGIRFGEMERDSLLAHGTAFLLHDRLMNCSDYSYSYVCKACGSILSPMLEQATQISGKRNVKCRSCQSSKNVEIIAVPYVFRYLLSELLAMNIRVTLDVK